MTASPQSQPQNASSPWSGQGPSPADRERQRGARRVAEHAVVLLLLASFALVLATSYPLILGLVEGHRPEAARRGIERLVRSRNWAVGEPARPTTSRYAPSPHPLRRTPGADALGHLLFPDIEQAEPAETAEAHLAISRGPLVLKDRADPTAAPVRSVTPETMMLVVKDTGEWLLLAVRDEERTVLGWARREQVAVVR